MVIAAARVRNPVTSLPALRRLRSLDCEDFFKRKILQGSSIVWSCSRHLTPSWPSMVQPGWHVTERPLEEAMQAYQTGDRTAFDQIYPRVAPVVYSYLLRLTRERSRAEDLLQTTFAKMHRARGSYIAGERLVPWLLAIARRTFLDECRRKKSRFEDLSQDGRLPEHRATDDRSREDLSDELARVLDGLPENYRDAIHLTKIKGLTLSEAAGVLNSTPTAVKLRVHRGYNLMRNRFEAMQVMRT